jgi:hypothetical protein
VHQIEREEEQRKALLEGANQDDDDFTWEDEEEVQDDEEQSTPAQAENKTPVDKPSITVDRQLSTSSHSAEPTTATSNAPSPTSQTPVCVSPRASEDSYDLVSSGNVSSIAGRSGEKKTKGGQKDADDGDESDWE